MRHLFALALFVCAPAVSRAGILSHWKFDTQTLGVTPDSVGTAHGQLRGTAAIVSGGVTGNAVQLSNIRNIYWEDYVTMGDVYEFPFQPVVGSPAFTVSAWIKPTANSQEGHIAGSYEAPGDGGGYVMTTNFGVNGTVSAYTGSVGTQLNGNNLSFSPSNTYNLYDGGWHHMLMSYTGGPTPQASLWINGKLGKNGANDMVGTGGFTGPTSYREFVVGGYYFWNRGSNIGSYTGLIDDVQVYDNALTAQQILWLSENPGMYLGQVPEPSTFVLLGVAGLGALLIRRRTK